MQTIDVLRCRSLMKDREDLNGIMIRHPSGWGGGGGGGRGGGGGGGGGGGEGGGEDPRPAYQCPRAQAFPCCNHNV